MQSDENITLLLRDWQNGDSKAYDRLITITYDHLRELSQNLLRRDRQRRLLQPTELLHECALRLVKLEQMSWQDRAHFFAMASATMRRVLVDQARRAQAEKRAGQHLTLVTEHLSDKSDEIDFEPLDQALNRLAELSEDRARIVELKFFGGLTNQEVAQVMGTSEATVKRGWGTARTWLHAHLQDQQ